MRIITTNQDHTVDELADVVFGQQLQNNEARAKLLAANPQLSEMKTIPGGTPVIVPDDSPSAKPAGVEARMSAAVQAAQRALSTTREQLNVALEERTAERDATIETLRSPDVVKARKASSNRQVVDQTLKEIEVQVKEQRDFGKLLDAAAKRLDGELKTFDKQMSTSKANSP